MMALKLSRITNSVQLDSMTDLIGYTEGLWNFKQEELDYLHKQYCVCGGRKDVPKHNLVLTDETGTKTSK